MDFNRNVFLQKSNTELVDIIEGLLFDLQQAQLDVEGSDEEVRYVNARMEVVRNELYALREVAYPRD